MDEEKKMYLEEYDYLFKKVLGHSPKHALPYCKGLLRKWVLDYSKCPKLQERMINFSKGRCLLLVWASDKFNTSNPLPGSTYRLLAGNYDELLNADLMNNEVLKTHQLDIISAAGDSQVATLPSSAEKDRYEERQLQQHLLALMYLIHATKNNVPLTVDLIKKTHQILMNGLYTEENEKIEAGEYRQCPVSAGMTHSYPDHTCIPKNMDVIVTKYNTSTEDDKVVLASRLLFDIVSLHPFIDGNGRLSRLLWCYSLMSNGLPFPVIPFQGNKKGYKMYINCITRDRDATSSELLGPCRYLSSLTLISVTRSWKNFLSNLKYEYEEGFKNIITWLDESHINLQ